MTTKEFSMPVMLLAFTLTLGMLFSGNWLYTEITVNKPLNQQLSEVEGVKSHTIENGSDMMVLTVELGLVDDIKAYYISLSEIANAHTVGSQRYEIRIIDNPNPQLTGFWNEIQFYAHQSLVQGDFVALQESLNRIVGDYEDVNHQIHINETHLFFQIQSGENYIYRVLRRSS